MLPLECQYLNKSALTTLVGPLTPPVKHFQLKRKPKSATLRAELLQKCMSFNNRTSHCNNKYIPSQDWALFFIVIVATETAQQLKKTAGVPFHAKGRGLVKKIDTTSESKTKARYLLSHLYHSHCHFRPAVKNSYKEHMILVQFKWFNLPCLHFT